MVERCVEPVIPKINEIPNIITAEDASPTTRYFRAASVPVRLSFRMDTSV